MQNPYLYSQIKAQPQPQFPEQEHLKCPRCDSSNTKFCYYNNYNLSQPRHFCKSCKRYWTKGGSLRNIPVGGGSRKNTKRSSSASASSSSNNQPNKRLAASVPNNDCLSNTNCVEVSESAPVKGANYGVQFGNLSGDFSSLFESSSGQFGGLNEHLGGSDQAVRDGFLNIEQGDCSIYHQVLRSKSD